jgi:C1A family cysteine protease
LKTIHRIVGLIIVTLVIAIISGDSPDKKEPDSVKLSNPAYDYCVGIMGYEYQVITQADGGQSGRCKLPDDTTCSDWDFYAGKCGAEYSWCEQNGYNQVTRDDGKDPYSPDYAVCVDQKASEVGKVSSLSGLDDLAANGMVLSELPQKGDHPDLATTKSDYLVPASFDWTKFAGQDWITSVKNQSTCGACWAFSTVALTEAQQNIITKNPNLDLDLSEQYLVSDCYEYASCAGGVDGPALEYIRDFGIPDEACYPYIGVDSSCSARCSDYASRLKFLPNADWSYEPYYSSNDIKYYLSNFGPVTIAFAAAGTHGGYFESGTGIYRCTDDIGSGGAGGFNHSVLAVGYDDAGGYWIAKNSWGSTWNDKGYFKLGYNECNSENSQISWTQSSLPVTYDHFNHLPVIMKPTFPPGAFGKITPTNGSQEPHADQYLFDWSDSDGATGYDFCYDQTLDGECTGSWFSLSGSRSYINLGFFFPGYIYEWQIRATNSTGEATYADNGTVWSFTVANPP